MKSFNRPPPRQRGAKNHIRLKVVFCMETQSAWNAGLPFPLLSSQFADDGQSERPEQIEAHYVSIPVGKDIGLFFQN